MIEIIQKWIKNKYVTKKWTHAGNSRRKIMGKFWFQAFWWQLTVLNRIKAQFQPVDVNLQ